MLKRCPSDYNGHRYHYEIRLSSSIRKGIEPRNGSIHVATTKRKYNGKVYCSYLLRRSFREDGKVKNETVGNLSHLPDHVVDLVNPSLTQKPSKSAFRRPVCFVTH